MDKEKGNVPAVMPFGKYKGQPLETIKNDNGYLEWLTAQEWFRSKFPNIYTIIINNFREPSDTPEHNEMQIRFLNEQYRLKLAYLLFPDLIFKYNQSYFDLYVQKFICQVKEKCRNFEEVKESLLKINNASLVKISDVEFEEKGADVFYEVKYGYTHHFGIEESNYRSAKECFDEFWKCGGTLKLKIELKPSVGDDFPSILRQMKADKSNILVFRSYSASGATQNDCTKFFNSQGIKTVLENDIEFVELPAFDEYLRVSVDSIQ
jgi:uncharacterized protein (DUF3820 family)